MTPPQLFEEDTRPKKELRVLGAVCYFPLGFILPYLMGKNNDPFVLFHLRQGMGLFGILFLSSLIGIGGFVLFLYLIIGGITGYRAYLGETYMMGWISFLVEKFKSLTK